MGNVTAAAGAVRDALAALNATTGAAAGGGAAGGSSLTEAQRQQLSGALEGLEGMLEGLPLGKGGGEAMDSVGAMQAIVANFSRSVALDAAALMPEQLCLDVPNLPYLGVVFLSRFLDYASPVPTPPFDLFVAMHYLVRAEIESRGEPAAHKKSALRQLKHFPVSPSRIFVALGCVFPPNYLKKR